jgi:uncharacterized protein YecT (DUF1311 family)
MNALSQRALSGAECFGSGGNAAARLCLTAKARESESALVQAERTAVHSLEQSDEDATTRQRAVSSLKAASAAYCRYRKEQCGFQVALAAGGSGASERGLLCEIALNEERMSYIRQIRAVGQ